MPTNWSDDDLDDDEYPDDFDEDDEDSELLPCPECGRAIYEDSEQCPACGAYLTTNTSPFQNRPVWWLILGGLGVLAVVAALFAGGW